MNKKRKVTKRIAAWLLCLAIVLTTINLPIFAQVAAAEDIGDRSTSDSLFYTDYESDEEARQAECLPSSPYYLSKLLTYLSLKYPEIGIDPKFKTGGDSSQDPGDDLYNWYNATKMARQTSYDTIEINGNDTFEGYPELTKNMVQFNYLGNFGGQVGYDENSNQIYGDTVKTLIIRNVDEIRNLYVPASVETLIIENTTFNCYSYPGFQSGMNPGDLAHCKNLKKLVLKNVTFGDNYKNSDVKDKDCGWGTYDYETNYVLNLQNCPELSELDIDVSFANAPDVFLTIEGGEDNLFAKLTDDKCNISPAPGTDAGQVTLLCNSNSYLAKRYNSEQSVKFKNGVFRLWLINLGYDTNHDRILSQTELDAIETLTINDETAHLMPQTSLSYFQELADISQMHNLKTLDIDFYTTSPSYNGNENREALEGIDFPDSLENLSMKNVYWKKNEETKSHDNADIILTNLKTLNLYNTDVMVKEDDVNYFNHHTRIELTDTDGVLKSCVIEKTDVESITLTNSSEGKGILSGAGDEKQRIRFSAPDCPNLKSIEFLGEGYAIEGSLELTGDKELTHVGVPNADRSQWTVYGEYDMTYAPVNVILNSCIKLGSDCSDIVIDYDFVNGRDLYVYATNTYFSDDHALTIKRQPRIEKDVAGNVYLACDKDKWVYTKYSGKDGYIIDNRDSFPTIAVFAEGQKIRTSGDGYHNSDSIYTEDTDLWVDRKDLVLHTGLADTDISPQYKNNFGNLTFYVVDKAVDESGKTVESLRRVFYGGEGEDVYVEWEQQNNSDPIITLPTEKVGDEYKLTGSKISSTGTAGEVLLNLYVYKTIDGNKVKSYIGYQDVKIYQIPDSIELVNDGTARGSGTKDDPYIIDKSEELKLKARPLVNGKVDENKYTEQRNINWRGKVYDETPIYTSDSDGYSYVSGFVGWSEEEKVGMSIVRDKSEFETDTTYDLKLDEEYFSHRRFIFNTTVSKFKIVTRLFGDVVEKDDTLGHGPITEVFVEYHSKPLGIDISNDIVLGKKNSEEATITIDNVYKLASANVRIKNPEVYDDCFVVERESSVNNDDVWKDTWKLKINSGDSEKVKDIINSNDNITLVIDADGKTFEKTVALSKLIHHEAIAATCVAKGNIEYWTYASSENYYSDEDCTVVVKDVETPINPDAHKLAEAVKENEVAPTCETDGSYNSVVYCSLCDKKVRTTPQTVDALGHNLKKIDQVDATCQTTGMKAYYVCETDGCGAIFEDAEGKIKVTDENTLIIEKDAAKHIGETYIKDVVVATCTDKGYTGDTYCKDCGVKLSSGTSIDKKAHVWDEGTITTEPTCTEAGVRTYTCLNDASHTKTGVESKLGHNFAEGFTVDKEPTYTEKGSKSRHCSRCDATTDVTEIPMLVKPSEAPSTEPTVKPSDVPSTEPTAKPSEVPSTQPTVEPSTKPSTEPSQKPSVSDNDVPTATPSPSQNPSVSENDVPTATPSPSQNPSVSDNDVPTATPSPSQKPSVSDNDVPTATPSQDPSVSENDIPTAAPSEVPSETPSEEPSSVPSEEPSAIPSEQPSELPSEKPSVIPSEQPSVVPSVVPTTSPSIVPSVVPSTEPSKAPAVGDVAADQSTNGNYQVTAAETAKKEVTYTKPVNKQKTSYKIPDSVKIDGVVYKITKIEKNAFKNNTKVKTIVAGKNIKSIGANAFKGCKKLKTLTIKSTKLTSSSVAKNAFKGITKAITIKVPKKKLKAYKTLFQKKGLSKSVKVKAI